jgi:octopine/nopaline transport system substrate-binding protein
MGVKCELMAQAWDGMMTGLTDGKYDAVMDAITITAKRLEIVDFSNPYTTITSGFVVLKDSGLAKLPGTGQRVMLDDESATKAAIAALSPLVKGKTVGVQTASIQDDFLKAYFKGVVDIRGYSNNPDTFLDLTGERVDAVFGAWTNNAAFIKQSNGAAVAPGYTFGGGVLGQGQAVALRKGDPDLKAMFNKALAEVKADGTLKQLSMKWFSADITV